MPGADRRTDELQNSRPDRCVVILSGGLDSTTLLYHLRDTGCDCRALCVDYGQRHRREMKAALAVCRHAQVPLTMLDLSSLRTIFAGSSLAAVGPDVPLQEYDAASMQQTTVPNRNMILLSIAIGHAISAGIPAVAFGAHAGVNGTYPDCRPEFAAAMDGVARCCDWRPVTVLAPFIDWNKSAIVRRGAELDVPFELTWSCYVGGHVPCGRCGTCRDRAAAFAEAGITDPALQS